MRHRSQDLARLYRNLLLEISEGRSNNGTMLPFCQYGFRCDNNASFIGKEVQLISIPIKPMIQNRYFKTK